MKTFLVIGKEDNNAETIEKVKKTLNCHTLDKGVDYVGIIILGGDGTVLRALSSYRNPPAVYAINCGRVGFLCPIAHSETDMLIQMLSREEEPRFFEVKRLCLSPNRYFLNEAVLRSSSNRLSTFRIFVDDIVLVIRADAVIVATMTGSSGYSMSINGPLLLSDGIIINALAPNRCNFRPLVCELRSRIRVEIDSDDPLVIVDGTTSQEKSFEVFYDGSKIRFGYLNEYDKSVRIRDLFYLDREV